MQNGTILIVDDVPQNLRILQRMLSTKGYQSHPISDPREVLDYVKEAMPEMILLDINMPALDGFDVCKQLKAMPQLKDIPVIFISAYADTDNKVKGFECGAVDYITKPFKMEEVMARVETHLKIRRLQQELLDNNLQLKNEIEQREKLQEQVKQLHKAEAISKISAGIAHNFNNILAIIQGYGELATLNINKGKNGEAIKSLSAIGESTSRATKLVNKMMLYSKPILSRGASTQSKQLKAAIPELTAALHSKAEAILHEIKSLLPEKVSIELVIEPEIIDLPLDASVLKEVITQLCLNASEAIPDAGCITLGMRLYECEQQKCASCFNLFSGKYINLYVIDNGTGMDKELLQNVFDPYFTNKDMAIHEGMGLSIVHGVVHVEGGHILLQSEPDQGSRIDLLIPG